nr:MAG TPA: hypothetical protein [Caudoviricetes sp.]
MFLTPFVQRTMGSVFIVYHGIVVSIGKCRNKMVKRMRFYIKLEKFQNRLTI